MSVQDWVDVPYAVHVGPEPRKDERLKGFRLPLSEADWRWLAARELEPVRGLGYSDWMRMVRNSLTLYARTRVNDLDAVTAWENEGGA